MDAAQESAIALLTDEAIVCVSNYRSYELSCVGSDRGREERVRSLSRVKLAADR